VGEFFEDSAPTVVGYEDVEDPTPHDQPRCEECAGQAFDCGTEMPSVIPPFCCYTTDRRYTCCVKREAFLFHYRRTRGG
jgi:hypothetical protein